MREILFRAKMKTDNGEYKKGDWVFGDLVRLKDGEKTSTMIYGFGEVIPETVGQYTGLTDKNGKKIFEGDIFGKVFYVYDIPKNAVVVFRDGAFGFVWYRGETEMYHAFPCVINVVYDVIGNIHVNPELMKGATGDA